MIEFHGWVKVRYHTHDTDLKLQDACWIELELYVKKLNSPLIHLQRYNGCDSVLVAGQHNHRTGPEYVFELYEWIAKNASGSYGLLYVYDDEDISREGTLLNAFRVWRLRRGEFTEENDPFLSPFISTVEDAYDESRND